MARIKHDPRFGRGLKILIEREELTSNAGIGYLVTQSQISLYERGFTPIPASVMEAIT